MNSLAEEQAAMRQRIRFREYRKAKKAMGICGDCLKNQAAPERTSCRECLEKRYIRKVKKHGPVKPKSVSRPVPPTSSGERLVQAIIVRLAEERVRLRTSIMPVRDLGFGPPRACAICGGTKDVVYSSHTLETKYISKGRQYAAFAPPRLSPALCHYCRPCIMVATVPRLVACHL